MNIRSTPNEVVRRPRGIRTALAIAVLVGSLFTVVGPATPAAAAFHPMPTPTGPHHRHHEKNPSALALSRMSARQKRAVMKAHGSGRRYGRTRCWSNCVDPRIRVRSVTGPTRVGATAATGITATGITWCSWIEGWVWSENITGAKIWQFKVHTDYCWNDGTGLIISHHTTVHPTVYTWASAMGWTYRGTTEKSSWRPFGNNTAVRTYAQGHFDYCPPRIWCVQTKYPYIYLDVYGTGDRRMSKWGW